MKVKKKYVLLVLCLTSFAAFSQQKDNDKALLKKTSKAVETTKIKNGLHKRGIGKEYEIVVADDCDLVESTAAQEMQRFLAKASLSVVIIPESKATGKKRIILGRESNLKAIRDLGDKGDINIRSASTKDDGFHLKQTGDDIVIAGANPRGVLYGVYEFEDFITEGRIGNLDIRKVPQITSRAALMPTFLTHDHPLSYREATEKTVTYLARLGINGCIDGGGGSWELKKFVSSDIFSFQKAPDLELQRKISTTSSLCKKYGIDYYIMLWEPSLSQSEDLAKYPPEALGMVEGTWRGSLKTLCVSSPIVQEHYKNMVKKFVREYPDVKGFLFYNLDGNAWLCTPGLCLRCKSICKDSPADTSHPWETEVLFTDLLARTACEERSDFKFIHWISHFRDEAAEKLVRMSQEYSALAYGVQCGDHDVMIADPIVPGGSELLMLQKVCAEKSIPFYVTFSSDSHEVIPNGFQFPFHINGTMKKLHAWGVRGIIGCGPIPYFNQINALAEKEFQWDPDMNPEPFLADLSVRQFGKESGNLMYQAWWEIKNGMDVWKDVIGHPFRGSQTPTSLGFSYFTMAPAILPDISEYYHKDEEYLAKFKLMGTHMAKAAALGKQAVEKANASEPIGINYYDGDSIPTMKEYAELNYAPIAIADVYSHLRCNMISAYHLLEGMKTDSAAGNSAAVQEKEVRYHDLIRKDIAVRKRFVEILTEFSKMRPCLTRTSLSEKGIAHQITYMNTEIEKMKSYLINPTPYN